MVVGVIHGPPGGSDGKGSACNAGDLGLIPGLGRSFGEGNGNHSIHITKGLLTGALFTHHNASRYQEKTPRHIERQKQTKDTPPGRDPNSLKTE